MDIRPLVVFCGWLLVVAQGYAQGVINITFDGPPYQAPGTGKVMWEYYEAGMTFVPIDSFWSSFNRIGASTDPRQPSNNTTYLQAAATQTLMFSATDGSLFDFMSVDLAEYSTVVPEAVTVHFIGYFADGSTIVETRTTDGIMDGGGPLADFETFTFSGWTGLTRVEIPTSGWSLDNVVVRMPSVPEPTAGALLVLGGFLFWRAQRKRA